MTKNNEDGKNDSLPKDDSNLNKHLDTELVIPFNQVNALDSKSPVLLQQQYLDALLDSIEDMDAEEDE